MRSSDSLAQHARPTVKRCGELEHVRRAGWTGANTTARTPCSISTVATAIIPVNFGGEVVSAAPTDVLNAVRAVSGEAAHAQCEEFKCGFDKPLPRCQLNVDMKDIVSCAWRAARARWWQRHRSDQLHT